MKINRLIYVIAACAALWSCDLGLAPEDSLSPESYFAVPGNLELWTNRFYGLLDNADDATGHNADDIIDKNLDDYVQGSRSPYAEKGWSWTNLRYINLYLDNSHYCADDAARTRYDAVARCFRAYFYWCKVRRYGDVPYYDHVLGAQENEELYKPRDSREYVMTKVMEDFDHAIENLPSTRDLTHVTKWSALALKARAALYEGTFRKYHGLEDADKWIEIAADAAGKFIEGSGYGIYSEGETPYRDLFCSDDAIEKEVVLARKYQFKDLVIAHSIQFEIKSINRGFTRRFVNHYLMADGSRFTDKEGWQTMGYTQEVKGRDPRLAQTILCPGYVQKGAGKPTSNTLISCTGYQPIKFVSDASRDGADKGTSDFALIRTPEVYLIYAEARAELGQITQTDLDKTVNKIRARAKMPDLKLEEANASADPLLLGYYPNVTKSPFTGVILEIRRERTIELCMEGLRHWDMFRWKEGAALVNEREPFYGCWFDAPGAYDLDSDGTLDVELYTAGSDPSSSASAKFLIGSEIVLSEGDHGYIVALPTISCTWDENRDYLWPIPANQRVLTGGKLSQNPGWNDNLNF